MLDCLACSPFSSTTDLNSTLLRNSGGEDVETLDLATAEEAGAGRFPGVLVIPWGTVYGLKPLLGFAFWSFMMLLAKRNNELWLLA